MPVTQDDVDRLREIKDQMVEMADEALRIVLRSGDRFQYDRAKAYWHPHIQMALSDDHRYLGRDGSTLEEAVDALEGQVEDGDLEKCKQELEEEGETTYLGRTIKPAQDQGYTVTGHDFYPTLEDVFAAIDESEET
jgi:hypothetical protein